MATQRELNKQRAFVEHVEAELKTIPDGKDREQYKKFVTMQKALLASMEAEHDQEN